MRQIKWDEADIGEDEINAVLLSLQSGHIGAAGPNIKLFEEEFARKVGTKYAVAVTSGTTALLAVLLAVRSRSANVKIGVPTFSFIASANTAYEVFGNIRLLDCDPETWNIDPNKLPDDLDMILAADIGGLSCDYTALAKHGIPIIADSAESIGGRYQNNLIGNQALVHCFSLHRAKIITTGEGGMITTDDDELLDSIKSWMNHGYASDRKPWEYKHDAVGLNFRMTDIQAAMGRVQLKKLEHYVRNRQERATIYKEVIGDLAVYQQTPAGYEHPYFFFGMIIKKDQDWFCQEMNAAGIKVKTWAPAHKQKPYLKFGNDFPHANNISENLVLLPIHNKLSEEATLYTAQHAKRLLEC